MSEKRKRISFWESESEEIKEWCKAQTNLGTSLDLIIADAIQVYGKGDVIKAYLNQRMMDMQSQGSSPYVPSQHVTPASVAAPISSSASWQSKSETHQLPSDSVSIGNTIRHEVTSGPREQGDPSNMGGVGDMIRQEATSGSREQGDPSDMGAMGDMIRREATGSSSHAHTSGGERQDSNSANEKLNILLGDSSSRLI